nr:MAG TPA: hypothetical protein [Caudoviricetes sp.]
MASTDNIGFVKIITGPRKTLSNDNVEIETTGNYAINIGPLYLITTCCTVTLKKEYQANFDHIIHIDGLIPNAIDMPTDAFGFLQLTSHCTYASMDPFGFTGNNVYYVDLTTTAIDNSYVIMRFNPTTDFKIGTKLHLYLFRIIYHYM